MATKKEIKSITKKLRGNNLGALLAKHENISIRAEAKRITNDSYRKQVLGENVFTDKKGDRILNIERAYLIEKKQWDELDKKIHEELVTANLKPDTMPVAESPDYVLENKAFMTKKKIMNVIMAQLNIDSVNAINANEMFALVENAVCAFEKANKEEF